MGNVRSAGISPDYVRDVRARAWAFVLDCHRKRKAAELAPEPDGRDATTVQGDCADGPIIPERS